MSGRRKKHEEHENHERWLVSYADFITLLFAFFVVMYSVSSVNEGKYRVLSDALIAAFRSSASSLAPVQVGQVARGEAGSSDGRPSPPRLKPDMRPMPTPAVKHRPPAPSVNAIEKKPGGDALDILMRRLRESLHDLEKEGLVEVRRKGSFVEVEIRDTVLFDSGSATINASAIEPLEKIAAIFRDISNQIQVEGFTDNVPISTAIYPSNWELSAARAASVVRLLMEHGVEPERMAAIGHGEHKPIADTGTAEGRTRNRRVVLVILGKAAPTEEDLQTRAGGNSVAALNREDLNHGRNR
ncbi:MAG: flagellar motor protein MotD [Gammaproteobacteria bacterium]